MFQQALPCAAGNSTTLLLCCCGVVWELETSESPWKSRERVLAVCSLLVPRGASVWTLPATDDRPLNPDFKLSFTATGVAVAGCAGDTNACASKCDDVGRAAAPELVVGALENGNFAAVQDLGVFNPPPP